MKIFVYEHITGGGCAGQALPPALLAEGRLMAGALVADLHMVPQVQLCGMRDSRIEPIPALDQRVAHDPASWQASFDDLIREADATWLIAPETGGMLERLSRQVVERGKILLGCAPDAVAIAASKLATARALSQAGVGVVATC